MTPREHISRVERESRMRVGRLRRRLLVRSVVALLAAGLVGLTSVYAPAVVASETPTAEELSECDYWPYDRYFDGRYVGYLQLGEGWLYQVDANGRVFEYDTRESESDPVINYSIEPTSADETGRLRVWSGGEIVLDKELDIGRCYAPAPEVETEQLNHLVDGHSNVRLAVNVTAPTDNDGPVRYTVVLNSVRRIVGRPIAPGASTTLVVDGLSEGHYSCVVRGSNRSSKDCRFDVNPTPGVAPKAEVQRLRKPGADSMKATLDNSSATRALSYQVVQRNAGGDIVRRTERSLAAGEVKTVTFQDVPVGHVVAALSQSATLSQLRMQR